jgi:hypothetical protein
MQSDSPAVRPKPRLQHFAEVLMVLALARARPCSGCPSC